MKLKKSLRITTVLLATGLCLSGCVSDAQYKELEDRVSKLEKMLGVQSDTVTSSSTNSDQNTAASEDTQMIVNVTPENFGDYFEFVLINADYAYSEETMYAFVPQSKVFDEGWVYIDTSRDFCLTYNVVGSPTNTLIRIERPNQLYYSSPYPTFEIVDVKGQIRFEKKESLQNYEIDEFKLYRNVTSSDGTRYSDSLLRNQLDILY